MTSFHQAHRRNKYFDNAIINHSFVVIRHFYSAFCSISTSRDRPRAFSIVAYLHRKSRVACTKYSRFKPFPFSIFTNMLRMTFTISLPRNIWNIASIFPFLQIYSARIFFAPLVNRILSTVNFLPSSCQSQYFANLMIFDASYACWNRPQLSIAFLDFPYQHWNTLDRSLLHLAFIIFAFIRAVAHFTQETMIFSGAFAHTDDFHLGR